MRKIFCLVSAAVIVLGLASCNKEPVETTDRQITIVANTESGVDTKTSLSGDDQTGYQVLWSEGDKINVLAPGGILKYSITDGVGTTRGTFKGQAPVGNIPVVECWAYYATDGNSLSGISHYNADNVISSAPMRARITINNGVASEANFKNLCGLLRLTLKGSCSVKEIKVYTDKPLNGEFEIDNTDGHAIVKESDSAGNYVNTLDCGAGVKLTPEGTAFYIPMPQNNYSGVRIAIKDNSGHVCTKTLKAGRSLNIERSMITPVSLTVSESVVPEGALPGLFTVKDPDGVMNSGDERKVYFSKGNLYCVDPASDFEFKFEENQYDFPKDYPYNHDSHSISHVGHFFWSKASSVACAYQYSGSYDTRNDVLFTNNPKDDEKPNDNFTVDGITGLYRALSKDEWTYLFRHHNYRWVSVNGVAGCVIAPDGVVLSDDKTDYTSEELVEEDLVFLPGTGRRMGVGVHREDNYYHGYYWSSSNFPEGHPTSGFYNYAYYVHLTKDGNAYTDGEDLCSSWGYCIRLVTDLDYERPLSSSDIEKPEEGNDYEWE